MDIATITMLGVGSGVGMACGYISGRARARKTIHQIGGAFAHAADEITKIFIAILMEETKCTEVQAIEKLNAGAKAHAKAVLDKMMKGRG